MYRANQQNNSFLRTATHLGLLGALAASLTSACVSSSTNKGTGGATGGNANTSSGGVAAAGNTSVAGNTSAAGSTVTGGSSSAGGSSAVSTVSGCALDAGLVSGNACAPNPLIFPLDANCTFGYWAGDGISSGYFFSPWCNSPSTSNCTLTMACTTNSMHIAGSYLGSAGNTNDGNGGWGAHLREDSSDAGPGCQMIDGSGLTGVTVDINVTTIPAGNHLYLGVNLANGNNAEYTVVLAAGPQTVKIPWGSFVNKKACGSVPGPGITDFYLTFDWFNDSATHAVDLTISNLGFYN